MYDLENTTLSKKFKKKKSQHIIIYKNSKPLYIFQDNMQTYVRWAIKTLSFNTPEWMSEKGSKMGLRIRNEGR